jgi:uncharacterized protein YprB with RNaseH-like and TPR domain
MHICFFDLETTSLDADFGQLLCGVVGEYNSGYPLQPLLKTFRLTNVSTPEGRCNDHELAVAIRDELEQYDLVISYNGVRFDIPFLDTRLIDWNERGVRLIRHKDLLYTMRTKFRLQSNSLKNVTKFLFGETQKTEMSKRRWREAHAGNPAAYEEVIVHCHYDVLELARVWEAIKTVSGVLR